MAAAVIHRLQDLDASHVASAGGKGASLGELRHAGAIVTDDGGVACHAGIICRELEIPTLIGTGRATATIRDGDLVEVDATSQVVRILERAGAGPPAARH